MSKRTRQWFHNTWQSIVWQSIGAILSQRTQCFFCIGQLRPLTAMCYEITALWVLSALCARMYFFISGYCALAISWLSLAFCTTIKAVPQAWRFVVCILPLFLASELVRYAISDYQAVVAVLYVDVRAAVALGLAIGSLPRAIDLLLSCIGDLFGHTTAIARGIWLTVAAISNIITKAMTKFSLRMI